MDVLTRLDRTGGEPDDLAIAEHRLGRRMRADGDLVARRNALGGDHSIRDRGAWRSVAARSRCRRRDAAR